LQGAGPSLLLLPKGLEMGWAWNKRALLVGEGDTDGVAELQLRWVLLSLLRCCLYLTQAHAVGVDDLLQQQTACRGEVEVTGEGGSGSRVANFVEYS
jgi:hypothetical protein